MLDVHKDQAYKSKNKDVTQCKSIVDSEFETQTTTIFSHLAYLLLFVFHDYALLLKIKVPLKRVVL